MPDPHPSTAGTSTPRGALFVIFLTVFIDLLGFGIVLPVMPRQAGIYLEALGLPPAAEGATIGVLFSVFSLMQFLFSPWWGRISDTIGRRPVLLVSLAGSVVFYALYGLAVTLPPERAAAAIGLMLLSRIGAGIAGASVGTAAAVIADCTPPERRASGMALIGIAFGAGFTLGPLIAYFGLRLFAEQPWGVGALASLLSLVALLFALTVFKETRTPGTHAGRERLDGDRESERAGLCQQFLAAVHHPLHSRGKPQAGHERVRPALVAGEDRAGEAVAVGRRGIEMSRSRPLSKPPDPRPRGHGPHGNAPQRGEFLEHLYHRHGGVTSVSTRPTCGQGCDGSRSRASARRSRDPAA